jgi:serine/threonine-protein kinase RsbW
MGSGQGVGEPPVQAGPVALDAWEPPAVGSVVELTVPALTTFLDVVRMATAGLAARLRLSHDDIEDLRSAVHEACAMVLALPGPSPDDAALTCRYEVLADALVVRISAPADEAAALPDQSFAWRVLTTHASDVAGAVDAAHAWIELRKRRR